MIFFLTFFSFSRNKKMSSSKCTGPIKITGKSCPPQQGDPASAP